jgi:GNAT superfamily N-acetyltransferase
MPALPRLIEAADAETAAALVEALPPADADLLGVRMVRFGPALAVMARRLDVLALNRVIGAGMESPFTPDLLDEVLAWYERAGVPRFFLQLSPTARPAELRGWLAARGLAHYNNWVKFWRSADGAPRVVTDLRIERVGQGHALQFATIVARGFGMPDAVRPWLAATVGRAGWRHYLALDGEAPVAAAALYVKGETGWLGFTATDPAHQGRGAQSALVARRIADARALGCRRLVTESAEDTADRHAPSFHNLRRLGFELAYLRPNYLWRPPPGRRPAA